MKRELIGYAVIVGIVLGLFLDTWIQAGSAPVIYKAEAREPEEVLIRVVIDWNEERIKREIRTVFPENAEQMIKVAKCESSLIPDIEGPTDDHGIFQIHVPSHRDRIEGIDLYDPAENIRFARKLYDESGLRPWSASKNCWYN